MVDDVDTASDTNPTWLTPGVAGIGTASLLADLGHEVPTSLLPSLLTSTLGAPAATLGLIEGIADAAAGGFRLVGGALADDHRRRGRVALGGYAATAVLSALIGVAQTVWQVGVLRTGAWAARGLRVPARNALLADVVPADSYGRAYGFERSMDNLGAIGGPLLALGLVAAFGVRNAIALSIIPGLAAAGAIAYAIRHIPRPVDRAHRPVRLQIRRTLHGDLGKLMAGISAFEVGNCAATLLLGVWPLDDAVPLPRPGDRWLSPARHGVSSRRTSRSSNLGAPSISSSRRAAHAWVSGRSLLLWALSHESKSAGSCISPGCDVLASFEVARVRTFVAVLIERAATDRLQAKVDCAERGALVRPTPDLGARLSSAHDAALGGG